MIVRGSTPTQHTRISRALVDAHEQIADNVSATTRTFSVQQRTGS